MSFSQAELRAMSRLSPARRQAICREVYQETSRTAYLTASEDLLGLADAGMGKSLGKRIRKAVKKVVRKVEDSAKTAVRKVEDTAKKVAQEVKEVAQKIPGAKTVSNIGRKIEEAAKRAGGAVQRVAKEAARKAAPVLAITFPTALAVKSIRTRAAKFYRQHGPLIVTAVGAVLAPFTYGLSALAATALVKGRELYLARNEAIKAKKASKAEAAQMAVAVQNQEAALNEQCNQIYTQTPDSFLAIGLPPEKWATLSVDEKLRIIDSLSKGEIPSGYSLTQEAKDEAEAVRQQALNEELDSVYSQYQQTFEAYGYPPETWRSMTADQKMAAVEKISSETPSEATTGGPSAQSLTQTTPINQPSVVTSSSRGGAVWDTPPQGGGVVTTPPMTFSVLVEGEGVGATASQDEATSLALSKSSKGDRVEIIGKGQGTLVYAIRTDSGLVPVPQDQIAAVRALSHGEIVSKVSQAQASAGGAKTSGGFPWWLVAVPAVLFVGAKAKGA